MDDRASVFGTDPGRIDRLLAWPLSGDAEAVPVVGLEQFAEGPGGQIGRYKLRRLLGEGGMGMVYLAEQRDPVRRQVALKILKPGMDSRRVLTRFEVEQQALALMEHPHIAHVYDAGLAPSGRPYFVMEHVAGLPITEHCDQHWLTIEERLHLFLHVCAAVQHAHQKGIIHRDLKPSNILVTTQGQEAVPKVIDFGVARAISQPLMERTLHTELGQLIGTPEYMSPEQADAGNQDIDTRADIYSLGVILYELLAGVLPFDPQTFRTGGIDHIRKVICEEEPTTPSSRVRTAHHCPRGTERCVVRTLPAAEEGPDAAQRRRTDVRTLQRKLCGDLDWIALKALEKDRTRRYTTVDALAADILNHLNHQPVSAAPPRAWYRAKKFARRHRAAIMGASATTLLLLILLWAVRAHVQAGQERTHAQALEDEQILSQAWDQYGKTNRAAALETIEPILNSAHVGAQAQLLRAALLVDGRRSEEAREILGRLVQDRPAIAGAAHSLWARLLWESESLDAERRKEVEEHRRQAEALLPETAEAYFLRAMTALTIKEQLAALERALQLDPEHYESYRLRALIYQASRKYESLNEDALAMTLLRRTDPQGYSLRAIAKKGLGNYQEAIKDYDSAIRLTPPEDPQYTKLTEQRCEVLLRMGQYERILAEAQAGAKDLSPLQSQVFCALTALGRYDEASDRYQGIATSDPAAGARLRDRSMKHVFDMLHAGRAWHPADRKPEGPAFLPMLEAQETFHSLSAKAHRLMTDCFSGPWSPDGKKMALTLGVPGNSGVATYDPATKETDLLIVPGPDTDSHSSGCALPRDLGGGPRPGKYDRGGAGPRTHSGGALS